MACCGKPSFMEPKVMDTALLRSKVFDVDYYEEHKQAGLDYLGHGDWQKRYGRWFVESLGLHNHPVLDVGCACGSLVRGFGEAGCFVSGVDVNEHMIMLGKVKWPDMSRIIHVCDAINLHLYADNTFQCIHSAQVAEHWRPEYVPLILRELFRVTKPGGSFFCCVDTVEQYARQNRTLATEDPTHTCVKPMSFWHENLKKNGWLVATDIAKLAFAKHPDNFLKMYDWDWFYAIRS